MTAAADVWLVLPTYNEAENLEPLVLRRGCSCQRAAGS